MNSTTTRTGDEPRTRKEADTRAQRIRSQEYYEMLGKLRKPPARLDDAIERAKPSVDASPLAAEAPEPAQGEIIFPAGDFRGVVPEARTGRFGADPLMVMHS